MKTIARDILILAAVVNFKYTSGLPSYSGTRFLGYSYWNTRCDMNYADDWLGYWNHYYNGRTEYKRQSISAVQGCPWSCACSNKELQCSTFGQTTLYVYTPTVHYK